MDVFHRPVIPGFHPDPSICRVGDRYWLATSSFEYAPGVPIFTSVDLRSWRLIGHALSTRGQLPAEAMRPSGGIYAPTLRHNGGRFWLATTNVDDPPGQLIVTATDAGGPWSVPLRVPGAHGIDPDLTWGPDGTCWLSWSGVGQDGRQAILQAPLDTDTGALLAEPAVIWRGTGGQYPEAPHLYERHGNWYLLIAEGGTERGHCVSVARGPRPSGPFESAPHNPLLTARSTDRLVQNTGHADFTRAPDGAWLMVFLATRPRGSTPAWHVLGRETFAVSIEWEDGWPRLGSPIEPEGASRFEEAVTDRVPATWLAPSGWPDDVVRASEGSLLLSGPPAEPCFVGRRQQHFWTSCEAVLRPEPGSRGGLELRIDPWHMLTLWFDGDAVQAVMTIGGVSTVLGRFVVDAPPRLVILTEPPEAATRLPRVGPDVLVAGIRHAGGFLELARVDGRYISTEVAGGFTGRFIGLVAQYGDVHLESFTYRGSDEHAILQEFDDAPMGRPTVA